ncbi:TPA: hypothetical protein ACNZ7B_004473, partial [Klebsiella quasipneumoniae subsp. similipneumoniae]
LTSAGVGIGSTDRANRENIMLTKPDDESKKKATPLERRIVVITLVAMLILYSVLIMTHFR